MSLPIVSVVGTHHEFHNDELVQIALLSWYGYRAFECPAALKVRFYRSGEAASSALAAGEAQLLVGIGGGDWDEHKKEGRLQGECGATLAADLLGVRGNPELQLILQYALRADREAGQLHFELAEILKSLHGWSDWSQAKVLNLGLAFLRAIRHRESGAPGGDQGVKLESIVNSWLDRNFGSDRRDRCLKLILGEMKRWKGAPDEIKPFELPRLVEVMNSHGTRPASDIIAMVEAILDARVRRSYDFLVTCPQEERAGNVQVLEVAGYKVGFASSDSRSMGSYLRAAKKCDVIVLRKSTGNVNIFSGDGGKALMPSVVGEILRAELKLQGHSLREPHWVECTEGLSSLVASGQGRDLPGLPHWYYHLEAGALHNGTSTHPDTVPTALDLQGLARAVMEGVRLAKLAGIFESARPDRTGGG